MSNDCVEKYMGILVSFMIGLALLCSIAIGVWLWEHEGRDHRRPLQKHYHTHYSNCRCSVLRPK